MNAATIPVDFLPFSRRIVGLSLGTFLIHAHFAVDLHVNLARIPKAMHQIHPVPGLKVSIIPAIKVIAFQRN